MTAKIYEFIKRRPQTAPDEGGDIETLRDSLKEWHAATSASGCTSPLTALVWQEVDRVLRTDDLASTRNAATAVKHLMELYCA